MLTGRAYLTRFFDISPISEPIEHLASPQTFALDKTYRIILTWRSVKHQMQYYCELILESVMCQLPWRVVMSGDSKLPPTRFNRSQDHHELYLKLIRWELDDEMQNVLQKLQNWPKKRLFIYMGWCPR